MRVKLCVALALIVAAVGEFRAQGFLIPDTTRRDLVFDFAGQNLYISTSTGLIKTFDLSTFTFGRSYNLGGSLWGIDIARDDSFILAAQGSIGISHGSFQRVNLTTGAVRNINYTLEFAKAVHGTWQLLQMALRSYIAELPAGNYTAILRGVNNTTGVALVEVYDLD